MSFGSGFGLGSADGCGFGWAEVAGVLAGGLGFCVKLGSSVGSGTLPIFGGSLIGLGLKSEGSRSGGSGRSDKSPTGGRVISVIGGNSGISN